MLVPAAVALLLLLAAAPARGAGWERPVPGNSVARFSYDASAPFRAGARRNLWLAARPGEPVRAACAGRVAFAGRLPSRGSAVSLRCGRWHVTHLGVAEVTRARRVAAGARVGVAAGRVVRIGVRRTARPRGYVDPEAMLPGPPPPAGPVAVRPERRPPRPVAFRGGPPPGMRWPVWGGLAAVAVGCCPTGLRRLARARARRHSPSARVAIRSP